MAPNRGFARWLTHWCNRVFPVLWQKLGCPKINPPSRHHNTLKTIFIDSTLAQAAFARLLALGPNYDGWVLIPALKAHPPGRSPFLGDHFTTTSVGSKKYLSRSFHEIFRLHNA
jgi:hypothetical protein